MHSLVTSVMFTKGRSDEQEDHAFKNKDNDRPPMDFVIYLFFVKLSAHYHWRIYHWATWAMPPPFGPSTENVAN